jgi:hypothetical protein
MLHLVIAFAAAAQPQVLTVSQHGRAPIIVTSDRIARPDTSEPPRALERIGIRLISPEGVLWEGTLRVGSNQSANYSQNISQASTELCPAGPSYDRSERRNLNFSINPSYNQHLGQSYRVDASWARPVRGDACYDSGTRTVQIHQTVSIDPGKTQIIEGDAGLRVELTLQR